MIPEVGFGEYDVVCGFLAVCHFLFGFGLFLPAQVVEGFGKVFAFFCVGLEIVAGAGGWGEQAVDERLGPLDFVAGANEGVDDGFGEWFALSRLFCGEVFAAEFIDLIADHGDGDQD